MKDSNVNITAKTDGRPVMLIKGKSSISERMLHSPLMTCTCMVVRTVLFLIHCTSVSLDDRPSAL